MSHQLGTRPRSQRFHDVGIVEAASPVHQPRQKFTAAAVDRVRRLEALGVGSEEAKGLEDALVRAKRGANLAPVGERLDSIAQFVERCQKRLLQCRGRCERRPWFSETRQWPSWRQGNGIWRLSERRLQHWRRNTRIQPTVVSDESDQVSSLKARISQLEREQEDHRQKRARSLSVPSSGFERVVAKCVVARVGSSPRQISGSRCTREIESDGEHDCKGRQFGTEFEQVQPTAVRPVLRVDAFYGLRGIQSG